MHLLKFKSKDKKENVENESPEAPDEDNTPDYEKRDVPAQRSSTAGKDHQEDTNDLPLVNRTDQETEFKIPSRQELIPVFEELVAIIYQLEYNRGV